MNDSCLQFSCPLYRDDMCTSIEKCIFEIKEDRLNSTLGITYTAEEQEINEKLNQFS